MEKKLHFKLLIKATVLTTLCTFLSLSNLKGADNLINGGNMEDVSTWNTYWGTNAPDSGTFTFNYTDVVPAEGEGGCLRINAGGQAAGFVWQAITITPGHKYSLSAAYKNALGETVPNTWAEFFITSVKPNGGDMANDVGYALSTWDSPDTLNFDGKVEDYFKILKSTTHEFIIPDTTSQTEWYAVLKAGCWNAAGNPDPSFDILFDEVKVMDLGDAAALESGGNMEDESSWNFYWGTNAPDTGTYSFNYTDDGPAAGEGGCLRINAGGQVSANAWQAVTVTPGHKYSLSAAYKNASTDTILNTWAEFFLTNIKPTGGDITPNLGYKLSTWDGPDALNFDGTFQDDFTVINSTSDEFLIPDTTTQTEWYIVLKAGCWNTAGDPNPSIDILFDEVKVTDLGEATLELGGNMEDESLWNTYWGTNAPDSGTFTFNYTDVVPADGEGGCLRINAGGQAAGFVWQTVTITPGHKYSMSAAFKNASTDTIANTWAEFFLTSVQPTGGDLSTDIGYGLSTWDSPDTLNFDGKVEDYFKLSKSSTHEFLIPDTTTQTEWYIVLKAGCWNTAGEPKPSYDILFDEIKVKDLGEGIALVTSINLASDIDAVEIGETATVTATVSPSYAADISVEWSSSDDGIATVANGVVTGVAEGTATITATAKDGSGVVGTTEIMVNKGTAVKSIAAKITKVYPNPSNGLFIIETNKEGYLEVYNASGQMIKSDIIKDIYNLDLSSNKGGMYFLKVTSENQTEITKLLLKN